MGYYRKGGSWKRKKYPLMLREWKRKWIVFKNLIFIGRKENH
jgi:hypothetical protein